MRKNSIKNMILLFLAAVIWGTGFVVRSMGMEYIGPFTLNVMRFIIGGLSLIPIALIVDKGKTPERKAEEKKNRNTLILGGIACGVALCVFSNFQQLGLKYTTAGKAGFITTLYVVIVPVLCLILFRRRAGWKVWLGVAMSFLGLYLLCMSESLHLGKGDFYVLLCACVNSFYILIVGYFSPKVDAVKMSCVQFFTSGILSLLPMGIAEGLPTASNLLSAAPAVLYSGVFCAGVAYTLQIIGQKDVNPTLASLIMSLESVISALSGWLILHQSMSGRELLGCVLMFAAIVLAQLPSRKKEEKKVADGN